MGVKTVQWVNQLLKLLQKVHNTMKSDFKKKKAIRTDEITKCKTVHQNGPFREEIAT